MTGFDTDVLVAGAGIAGLACGVALAGAGHRVLVCERARHPRGEGGGIGVHTNALTVLAQLGIVDHVLDHAQVVKGYEFRAWSGRMLARWEQDEIITGAGYPSVATTRQVVHQALLSVLDKSVLRTSARCTGAEPVPGGVRVILADGAPVTARLLIAADGIRSALRPLIVGAAPLRWSGFHTYRGIVPDSGDLPPGSAQQTFGRGRTFGTWSLPDGGRYWVATEAGAESSARPQEDIATALRTAFSSAHSTVRRILDRVTDTSVIRTPIYDRPPAESWSKGRMLLVGDAAHPMLPVTGQGGVQALLDALYLGNALRQADLADGAALERAITEFQRVRVPAVAAISNEAWGLGQMHHMSGKTQVLVRDTIMRLTPARIWRERMASRIEFPAPLSQEDQWTATR